MTSEFEVLPEEQTNEPGKDGDAAEAAPAAAYKGPTAGQLLKAEREKQGLTQEEVVTQSRMTLETVRALEEDRDPPQNAWVYVRGYYRKYAKVLGLAEEDLLKVHEQTSGGAPEPEPLSTEWAPTDVSPGGGFPRVMIVLVVGVLLGGAAWLLIPGMLNNDAPAKDSETSEQEAVKQTKVEIRESKPVSTPAPAAAEASEAPKEESQEEKRSGLFSGFGADNEAPDDAEESVGDAGQTAVTEAPSSEQSEGESTSAPAEPGTVHQRATTASGNPKLGLEFIDRSWVNVVDATGKKLLDGIVRPGAEFALEGEPPFRIFLGYAPGVKMSYKGRMLNLEPYIESNNTARFKVGATQ